MKFVKRHLPLLAACAALAGCGSTQPSAREQAHREASQAFAPLQAGEEQRSREAAEAERALQEREAGRQRQQAQQALEEQRGG